LIMLTQVISRQSTSKKALFISILWYRNYLQNLNK